MSQESDFEKAQRRITEWQPGETLNFTGLAELARLPEEISGLTELRSLIINNWKASGVFHSPLSDLSPLRSLTSLQELDFGGTLVTDLSPLCNMAALKKLSFSSTSVSDISSLRDFKSLQTLDCSNSSVNDLSPLQNLTSLHTLDCSFSFVGDLSPLHKLNALQELYCLHTAVSDLGPLQNLQSLKTLSFIRSQVCDLGPLSEYYRDHKSSLPESIKSCREGIVELLICGHAVDEAFCSVVIRGMT